MTRPRRTLKPIMDATRSLLSEGRLDSATIGEFAQRAGVSRRSVHNHASDRGALAKLVLDETRAEFDAGIAAALTGVVDPAERMVLGILVYLQYGLTHGLTERALMQNAPRLADPSEPGLQRLVGELRRGERRGVFSYVSLDAAVVLVLGVSDIGLAQLQALPRRSPRASALLRELGCVVLQGLRVDVRRIRFAVDAAMARQNGCRPVDPLVSARARERR